MDFGLTLIFQASKIFSKGRRGLGRETAGFLPKKGLPFPAGKFIHKHNIPLGRGWGMGMEFLANQRAIGRSFVTQHDIKSRSIDFHPLFEIIRFKSISLDGGK